MLLPQECSHLQPVMWTQAAVGNFYCITYIFYCMFTSRSFHCNLVSCRQNRKRDMHNCLLHKTVMNLFLLHPRETPNNVTYGLFYVIRQYFHSCFSHVAFVRTFSVGSYLVFLFPLKAWIMKMDPLYKNSGKLPDLPSTSFLQGMSIKSPFFSF